MTRQAGLFDDTEQIRLSLKELAALFEVTPSMIAKMSDQGMPRLAHNVYDLVACVRWYLNFWRERVRGGDADGMNEKRAALIVAQTERAELETARLRGELLDAEAVAAAINTMAATIASQLDGLAARIAADLAPLDDPATIQGVLQRETRSIRASIARQIETLHDHPHRRPDPDAAAGADRGPMGRRPPRTPARKSRAGAVAVEPDPLHGASVPGL